MKHPMSSLLHSSDNTSDGVSAKRARPSGNNVPARVALESAGARVEDLGGGSWVALVPQFRVPNNAEFEATWEEHPDTFHLIKMFGKEVPLPRWQQAYGASYQYTGSVSHGVAYTPLIVHLLEHVNRIFEQCEEQYVFNMALCNWYLPEHYIGPHSDDVRQLVPDSPIIGLSWGRTRTFKLTPVSTKDNTLRELSLDLKNGDLVVMGGKCQSTHKHQIIRLAKGAVGNRINFTFRCFKKVDEED